MAYVYRLMMNAIKQGKLSKDELSKKANVFYMAGQLTEEEYTEIMAKIDELA